jgi:hypothetical protein
MKWTVPIFIVSLFAAAILYTLYIDSKFIIYFGNALQIGSLLLAVINADLARRMFAPDDEPRKAWGWLAIGLVFWLLGQILGSYREMILQELPYGDISDVFWIVGYVPFVMGLVFLIRSFLKSELPIGGKQSYLVIALVNIAFFVLLLWTVIWPEIKDPTKPFPEKLLDVAYPALDILLLALSAILFRISWTLRGGSLANTWLMLCLGITMTCIADLLLTHISELSTAYRYLDFFYFSSYFCIAIAGSIQLRMQRL